jgi:OOP family OmpA-OmpF porin
MDYLVGVGVESGRLTAIGRGESEPLADNNTESGRAENRRVDFLVKKRER